MKLKFEKNMRIITDLLGYCAYLGSTEFHVDCKTDAEASHITIQAEIPHLDPAVVQELSGVLNTPRQRDVEQNYWNLAGGEEVDGELLLAGIMVDSASVVYQGSTLTIEAERIHYSSME